MKKLKILITGGAGFIASNIADAYIANGHSVTIVDNLSSGSMRNVNKKAKFVKADITNKPAIKKVFKSGKFDILNHHAAQIDVRKSVEDPAFDARVNILGTLNLLENCKEHGVGKVIFASSGGTIYGECSAKAPDETADANPLSPYGITKYAVEVYLRYYASLFGLKYTILRYANVYGPRQDPHGEAGVVAIFSQKMLKNEKLNIFGNGRQTRDYVFVGDVVRANVLALSKADNQIINIGTAKLTSVNQLFKNMASLSGYKNKPAYKPARPGELFKSFLNYGKAKKVLGWQPAVSLQEGLGRTIRFFSQQETK
ncbi:MAG TPA: UDP-glucose 4-epimerase [Elusimicrobia bacterium]|nr:MAG: UDP-glucose 4-epimerase [Elusimicrobia bacterium RIFOXYA12_FULL_49_49]OGS16755.1 MAG: UDP-glucose 4-epimerase [Elusimicrobia bacterium RIFOXYA2_FULL_47_53]OGS27036.1 MAG: UDP-glucose 4-epimerase [Elusimicrobia bacterium RIFOXYB12_FULL_50_12]OGS31983.1 MAG: UDP-glucose 4-epimerase [Elusimicrobia bacterium RIFOXYB2_FULL_46_23]HBU69835.1 UDP-glucose 4-epimerase [Elusimicrobiota bacterium]